MAVEDNSSLFREGSRIFGSMGDKPCPLGCIYCFVNSEGYEKTGRVDTEEAKRELTYEIEESEGVKTLLPAHDVELFLVPDWFPQLMELADYGLDIIIATKSSLTQRQVDQLVTVDNKLREKGALLQMAVTITRLDAEKAREIELFTPDPERRIATAKKLYEAGLATNIAIRPTLPFVPKGEYADLIKRTYEFSDSYLTSPLYLTPEMTTYMDRNYPGYQVEVFRPSFMRGQPPIRTVNTDRTSAMIAEIAAEYGKPCFNSATPSIQRAHALRGR